MHGIACTRTDIDRVHLLVVEQRRRVRVEPGHAMPPRKVLGEGAVSALCVWVGGIGTVSVVSRPGNESQVKQYRDAPHTCTMTATSALPGDF